MYKRYMVFTYSEYDNVSPFECVDSSFDNAKEAIRQAEHVGRYSEDGMKLYCIFDRVDGVFLEDA